MIFLLAIVSAIALINGIFWPMHAGLKIALLIGGVLGLIWAYFWQLIAKEQREAKASAQATLVAEALVAQFKQPDFELQVFDESKLLIWACLSCAAITFFISLPGFIVFLLASIFALIRYAATTNKPVLILTGTGITLANRRSISWPIVQEVSLIFVPQKLSAIKQWELTLTFQTENQTAKHTRIVLSNPSQQPELILKLVEKLRQPPNL